MSKQRANIKRIAIVNWRGIDFQILDLDAMITALEGENGAGKTTILTAFYLAMLPDVGLVKVQNVGDTEDSGRESGLHGKLGDSGPCYTVLDLCNPRGERVIAGVQIYAKTAPSVETGKMFVIRNISEHVPLERILTSEKDGKFFAPEMSTIEQQAALFGGEIESFKTVAQYGNVLFKQGIQPINLNDTKSRKNFNKLLQTSFQGGFSKHLQERLKDYLLGDDPKIKDSVSRMEENLERCRKTRSQLSSLQEKIRVVENVRKTGFDMMDGFLAGVRLQADEHHLKLVESRKCLQEARSNLIRLTTAKAELESSLKVVEKALEEKKEKKERAEKFLENAQKAHSLSIQIKNLEIDLELLQKKVEEAEGRLDIVRAEQDKIVKRLENLNQRYADICSRVASAEEAWKQISRESGLYKEACSALSNAQGALSGKKVSAENAQQLLVECKEEEASCTTETVGIERKLQRAKENEKFFNEAYQPLSEMVVPAPAHGTAYIEATTVDRAFKDKEQFVETHSDLDSRIVGAVEQAKRQKALKESLAALGSSGIFVKTAQELQFCHARISNEVEEFGELINRSKTEISRLEKVVGSADAEVATLMERCQEWEDTETLRGALEKRDGVEFKIKEALSTHLSNQKEKVSILHGKKALLSHQQEKVRNCIDALIHKGSESRDSRLEKLETNLDGKLIASIYEETPPEEAGEMEARLGPLVNAIMVENLSEAIEKLDAMRDIPPEVWLVEKCNLDQDVRRYKLLSNAIAAKTDKICRVTQFPEFPQIGRLARKKRITHLRNELDEIDSQINNCTKEIATLESNISDLQELERKFKFLEGLDPRVKLTEARNNLEGFQANLQKEQIRLKDLESSQSRLSELTKQVLVLLPDGYLLDAEDFDTLVAKLQGLKDQVESFKAQIENNKDSLARLRIGIENLRTLPLSKNEIESLEGNLRSSKASWEFWNTAKSTVSQLVDKLDDFRFKGSHELRQSEKDPAEALRREQQAIEKELKALSDLQSEIRNKDKGAIDEFNLSNAALNQNKSAIEQRKADLSLLDMSGTDEELEEAKILSSVSQAEFVAADQEQKKLVKSSVDIDSDIKLATSEESREALNFEKIDQAFIPAHNLCKEVLSRVEGEQTLKRLLLTIEEVRTYHHTSTMAFRKADAGRAELKGNLTNQSNHKNDDFRADQLIQTLVELPTQYEQELSHQRTEDFFRLWQEILSYISQILPRDCVQTDDPVQAAKQMNDRYKSLEKTLEQQEKDFKSDSKNVSNAIKSRINDEAKKVNKINKVLTGISFGNIEGIMIEFRRRDDMMSLLEAMQDQEQWRLFQDEENLSLEEAMEKVYRRITGGQVHGQELLDYRKYIQLTVKVKRKSETKWEKGSVLSTGEAIGTGASILMVILGAWEDQYSWLKDKDLKDSMRFLFMDEATRLDPKSIQTLLDFCKQMNVQLLIAGPRFEGKECGSGITYRVVRKNFIGGEQVVIRGRKGFGGDFEDRDEAA